MADLIDRQAAIDVLEWFTQTDTLGFTPRQIVEALPSAQPEDYAELKREFNLMAAYIDAILRCSDKQKETLNWFISRLAKLMPWAERSYSD